MEAIYARKDALEHFTFGALLYGDYPRLAERCLGSLRRADPRILSRLRLGMNACGERTKAYVQSLVDAGLLLPENLYVSEANAHKYPMLRRMIHDPARPVATPLWQWFDDDSFLRDEAIGASPSWLERVAAHFTVPAPSQGPPPADMIGGVYSMVLQGNQPRWIAAQPWHTGRPFANRRVQFATGGWWTIRTEILKKYDYPWASLDHRGGDVMLGALLHQQSLQLQRFNWGVAINADEHGRESKSKRRGFDQAPIGLRQSPPVRKPLRKTSSPPPASPTPASPPVAPRLILFDDSV